METVITYKLTFMWPL